MANKQCQYCKRSGFHWVEMGDNKWRLADSYGNLHTCAEAGEAYRLARRAVRPLPKWAARQGSAQVTAGRVPPGVRQQPRAEPAPMPTQESPGFKLTPCMIAISEGRSKYSPAEAATDTRRFNDMDVFPLVTTGPEFQFIGV